MTDAKKEAINRVIDDAHARLKHDMEAAEATKDIPNPADFVKAARELAEAMGYWLELQVPTEGQPFDMLKLDAAADKMIAKLYAFRAAGGGE